MWPPSAAIICSILDLKVLQALMTSTVGTLAQFLLVEALRAAMFGWLVAHTSRSSLP